MSHEQSEAGAAFNATSETIPPVQPPTKSWRLWGPDERKQFEKDGSQSHNVRRVATYGGLFVAIILYTAGLFVIAVFLGLWPGSVKIASDMLHIVVAILIALFTVPTVLVIAILRVTSPAQDSELPTTAHEAIGKMVEKAVDKFLG